MSQVLDRVPLEEALPSKGDPMALRVSDRGDCCGAQAFYHAIRGSDDLLFCRHHGLQHIDMLTLQGWEVLDETDKINGPSISANV